MKTVESQCPYSQFKNSSSSMICSMVASFVINIDSVLKKYPLVENIQWIDLQKLPDAIRAEIIKKKLNITDIIQQDPIEILEEYSQTLLEIFQTISQNLDIQEISKKILEIKYSSEEWGYIQWGFLNKQVFHDYSFNLQLYSILYRITEQEVNKISYSKKYASWMNYFRFQNYMNKAHEISQIITWEKSLLQGHFCLILNELLSIYLAMSNRENAKKLALIVMTRWINEVPTNLEIEKFINNNPDYTDKDLLQHFQEIFQDTKMHKWKPNCTFINSKEYTPKFLDGAFDFIQECLIPLIQASYSNDDIKENDIYGQKVIEKVNK